METTPDDAWDLYCSLLIQLTTRYKFEILLGPSINEETLTPLCVTSFMNAPLPGIIPDWKISCPMTDANGCGATLA